MMLKVPLSEGGMDSAATARTTRMALKGCALALRKILVQWGGFIEESLFSPKVFRRLAASSLERPAKHSFVMSRGTRDAEALRNITSKKLKEPPFGEIELMLVKSTTVIKNKTNQESMKIDQEQGKRVGPK